MEDSTDSKHLKQKEFLQVSYNPNQGKKLQEMNNLEEIQCWSDSQIRIENSIKCDMTQLEIYNQRFMNYEFLNNEQNKSLMSLQSQQQEVDMPGRLKIHASINTKDKSFSFQSRFTPLNITEQNRSFIDGYAKRNDVKGFHFARDKQSSFNQRVKDSPARKVEIMIPNNFQIFSRIKMKILQFYRLYTVSGRTSVVNNEIKEYIRDLSDNLLSDLSKKKGICLFLEQLFEQINKIGRLRIFTSNQESSIIYWILVLFTLINCMTLYIYSCLIIFQPEQSLVHTYLFILKIVWIFELSFKVCSQAQLSNLNSSENSQTAFPYFAQSALSDIIPFIIIITTLQEQPVFQTLVFIKITNCLKDVNVIQKQLCMVIKKYYIVQLINLIIKLFVIGHIIACLWFLVGKIEVAYFQEEETWIDQVRESDKTWWRLYIWSIYWSLTLMTTGSNVATTITQGLFTSVVMLFITITFGYILNVIADILQQMDEDALQKRKDINIINEYMRGKNISKSLQQKVNLNLEYYYDKNCSKTQEQNDEVLQKISSDLQNQIIKEYNKKIFNKIQLLTQNFSSESLEELSLFVKEEQYFPNQFLIKDSEVYESSIMFIISGKVELYHKRTKDQMKNNLSFKILTNGDILGEIGFFTGQSESYIAKSTEFTKIIKIDRHNFINIIKKKENDYEKYCQIKDNILLYQEYRDLKMYCDLCKLSNHQMDECFLTHFNKTRACYVIGASQKVTQKRQYFQRKFKNKEKSLTLIKLCLQTSQFLQHNYSKTELNKINYSESDDSESLLSSEDDKIIDLDPSRQSEVHSKENLNNIRTQEEILPRCSSIVEQVYNQSQIQNDLNAKTQKYITHQISALMHESSELNNQENIVQLQRDIQDSDPYLMDTSPLKLTQERKKTSNLENSKLMMYFESKDYSEKEYPKSRGKKKVKNQQSYLNIDEQRLRNSSGIQRNRGSIRSRDHQRQRGGIFENGQTIFNLHQQIQLLNEKYLGKQVLIEESSNIFNPWDFESLKDYQYYFPSGNSKNLILKHQKYLKKRNKMHKSEKLKK